MMGGGGKGGGSGMGVKPTYTDPVNGQSFTAPSDLNSEITYRKQTEDAQAAAQKAADAQKANDAEYNFGLKATDAKNQATTNIYRYFQDHGVDPKKYASQIADSINTASGNVADLDANPGSKYAPTLGSDLYNQLTSGTQSQNLASFNKTFDPSYSLTALPADVMNPAIDSIVNGQFDPLSAQLSNAQKRGTLNSQGYQAALDALNKSKTGATATVNKLAQGVLNSDRGGINDYIGTGRTAAGSAPLNSQFSTDPYVKGVNDLVSRDTSSFGGDLQNAVGSTKFSDLTTLLNSGGAVQGAGDPTAGNPNGAVGPNGQPIGGDLSPSFIAQQALAKEQRGLGTQGAF